MRVICIRNNKVEAKLKAASLNDLDHLGYDLYRDASTYSTEPDIGDDYDPVNDQFSLGNLMDPSTMSLSITLSAEVVAVGTAVTATVEVHTRDGQLAPINADYYAPLLSVDGTQDRLLKISMTNGSGSVTWSPSMPGIFRIDMDKIRPKPSANLGSTPELIVESAS
ncbi:MAG: hypothetical protein AB2604_10535 [Candidatus Thiodiazotropha taylori]